MTETLETSAAEDRIGKLPLAVLVQPTNRSQGSLADRSLGILLIAHQRSE